MPQSNQAHLLPITIRTIPLTFGFNVQLRSEPKWPSSDIGRDSQKEMIFGEFGCFLVLFIGRVVRLHLGGEEEAKAVDPQRQTTPSYPLVRGGKQTHK